MDHHITFHMVSVIFCSIAYVLCLARCGLRLRRGEHMTRDECCILLGQALILVGVATDDGPYSPLGGLALLVGILVMIVKPGFLWRQRNRPAV